MLKNLKSQAEFGFLFFTLLLISVSAQAQYPFLEEKDSLSNYIIMDSVQIFGGKLIDDGERVNAKFCQLQKAGKIIKYTPYDVMEYGYKDGRVYFARNIQLRGSDEQVFLERLVSGETSLYYYEEKNFKTFFLEKDSTEFIELPKYAKENELNNYKTILTEMSSDYPGFTEASEIVEYKKLALSKFIEAYNKGEIGTFPYFKYGLLMGYGSTILFPVPEIPLTYLNALDFEADKFFTIGFFVDNPIQYSNISVRSEFYFSNYEFSQNMLVDNNNVEVKVKLSSFNLPLLLRYTVPLSKIRPFFNAGGLFNSSYTNEATIYNATRDEYITFKYDTEEASFVPNKHFGASVGGGVEYKINYRNTVFFEVRYSQLYGKGDFETLSISQSFLLMGISF